LHEFHEIEKSMKINKLNRKILLDFSLFILLIAGAPIAIRLIYAELAPFWMGFLRYALATYAFWVLVLFRHLHVPNGKALFGMILYGIMGIGVSFVLISWGLVSTSASLASIFLALVPLLTVLFSAVHGLESLTGWNVTGSLLAVVGTVIAGGGVSSVEISLPHIGAIVLGTAFIAESGVVLKGYPVSSPILVNAVSTSIGALILAIASLMFGEPWVLPTMSQTWIALGYLITVTMIAFILYLEVLNNWTASGTSYSFVIVPVITVILASIIAQEKITVQFVVGSVLVLIGVITGAFLQRP
jgi:drug/metabolite transporter (DMT)-like permease